MLTNTNNRTETNKLIACLSHFNEVGEQLSAAADAHPASDGHWMSSVQHRYQASFDLIWRAIERQDVHAFTVRVSETIALIQRTLRDVTDTQVEARLQRWVTDTQADFTALCSEQEGRCALAEMWGAPVVPLPQASPQLACA